MFFFKRKHLDTQEAILRTQNEILNELKQLNEYIESAFGMKKQESAGGGGIRFLKDYYGENVRDLLKEIRDRTKDGVTVTQSHGDSFRVESY